MKKKKPIPPFREWLRSFSGGIAAGNLPQHLHDMCMLANAGLPFEPESLYRYMRNEVADPSVATMARDEAIQTQDDYKAFVDAITGRNDPVQLAFFPD